MAPHTLLIDREEAHCGGVHLAWPRIKRVIAHQWELGRPEMAWLCFCPPEAVRISRVGPIHLAHGGEWARCRELESLCWDLPPLQGTLRIRGKAIALRPDFERPGRWRALTEREAINAERVLPAYAPVLTQPCSDRWSGLLREISGEPLMRIGHASTAGRERILLDYAQRRAEARRAIEAAVA
ncbi:MAG: hypothetical protein ACRC1L_05205 [Prochlorococcaceae cyanobacterium]